MPALSGGALEHGVESLAAEASNPLADGLAQLDDDLGGLGLKTGWLVIFDRRSEQAALHE